MLTDRNQLPAPEAIQRPEFETYLADFKAEYVARIRADDAALADQVEQTLESEGELLTKMAETFTVMLINEVQRRNQQVLAVLPGYASGTDLDNVVAHHGIERQVLEPGDPNAYPPVPAKMESDEDLLLRYWLAPHAPAAGSRLQYRALGLMLDEQPAITLDKPAANQVRLTYTFEPDGLAAQIKDAQGRRTAPGAVRVPVLAREGGGVPTAEQLDAVRAVFARDHVVPETDDVTVTAAELVDWQADVVVWVSPGPDTSVLQAVMEQALDDYAESVRVLGGSVQRSMIDHALHKSGAKKIQINTPVADVVADYYQAPRCTSVSVEVRTL